MSEDLPKAIKDLKDMKLAFLLVGDEEKEAVKEKFLRDCRKQRGEPEPPVPRKLSGDTEEIKGEEVVEESATTGPTDEMRKLVKKIADIKRREKQS